tara:strand:- start:30003 stop:30347 length:345 start_codon:yes stop_codon:yes gene_type:complete
MEIIKTAILSLIAIAIIHHLYLMFKNNLTVPKTKFIDPENSSTYTPDSEPYITTTPTTATTATPTTTTIEIGDTTSINDLVSLDTTENIENEQNEQKTQLKDYIKNITVTSLDN